MFVIAQLNAPPWWAWVAFFACGLVFALLLGNRDAGFFERLFKNDPLARLFGLGSILFGLSVAYFLIYETLFEAIAKQRTIHFNRGAVALCSISVLFGLILLLAGNRSHRFVITRHGQSLDKLQRATLIVVVAFCLALEFGFHKFLQALGYSARW